MGIFLKLMLMIGAFSFVSCSDNLAEGSVDLGITDKVFQYPESYDFHHPCALVSDDDIARVKSAVASASLTDPVYVAYQNFCNNRFAQHSYKASPVEVIVAGDPKGTGYDKDNSGIIMNDAAAAYQLALRWRLSDDPEYAEASVAILNAWASKCQKVAANDNNQYLCLGFRGYTLANAAELLRDYEGWTAADQNNFKAWRDQ